MPTSSKQNLHPLAPSSLFYASAHKRPTKALINLLIIRDLHTLACTERFGGATTCSKVASLSVLLEHI